MDEVDRLIRQLNSEDVDTRIDTVWKLVAMGKPAVPALVEALKDENSLVRQCATTALGAIEDKSVVPALLGALKDEYWGVVSNAVDALGERGDVSAVPALIDALQHGDLYVRIRIGNALKKIGEPAIPVLLESLQDEDYNVRNYAADALVDISKKCQTIEPLETIEKGLIEYSKASRKGRVDKTVLLDAQFHLAEVLKKIAERKNELAPKRDLLLPDTVKPPKKGDVYNSMRRVTNG